MLFPLLAGGLAALLLTLPLAWKWELGVRRVGLVVTGLSLLAAGLAALVGAEGLLGAALVLVLTVGAAVGILAWRFYRDPERVIPGGETAIVSPADGEVIYVRRSQGGIVPVSTKHGRDYRLDELTHTPFDGDDAVVVGIAMSFLDVHVNRAPIAGRVTLQKHFPGLFGSLKDPEMMLRNERATTIVTGDGIQVAMVQIASRLVRQIVSYVHEGDALGKGQRFGVIRLGSQVDLVLPDRPDLQVAVAAGDRVRAGETIVAVVGAPNPDRPGEPAATAGAV